MLWALGLNYGREKQIHNRPLKVYFKKASCHYLSIIEPSSKNHEDYVFIGANFHLLLFENKIKTDFMTERK